MQRLPAARVLKQECQGMIRFQIIERAGASLYKTLIGAMRKGELRTFEATKRGRRIQHKNLSYPGWMNWSVSDGIINCEVISPHKPGREWQLFSAFVGRLADRYADRIVAINVQFPDSAATARKSTRARNRRRSRRREQFCAGSSFMGSISDWDAQRQKVSSHTDFRLPYEFKRIT
jgi:hypothetical protein